MIRKIKNKIPELLVSKIEVEGYQDVQSPIEVRAHLVLESLSVPVSKSFALDMDSTYIYFYMVQESEESTVSSHLMSRNRKKFINSVENKGYLGIKKRQSGVTKMAVSEVIKADSLMYRVMGSDKIHQCFFDLKLKFDQSQSSLVREEKNNPNQGMSLFVFLDTAPKSKIGLSESIVVYEKLLEYSSATKKREIPTDRNIYVINEPNNPLNGQMYTGPVHHHARSDRSQSGYMGWMSGEAHSRSSMRLNLQKINNNRIQSPSENKKVMENSKKIPENVLLNSSAVGAELEKSTDSYNNFLDKKDKKRIIELVRNSLLSKAREKANFITKETRDSAYYRVYEQDGVDILNTSYCGSIIGIDIFSLLRSQSSFGAVIDFHHRKKNYKAVTEMINLTRILNLEIKRVRISKDSDYHNAVGTPIRGPYNEDLPKKTIISTSPSSKPNASVEKNALSEIQEVNLVDVQTGASNPTVRTFSLKDYDLFHNVDFGTYTYEIEMVLEDGVLEYVKGINKSMKAALSSFGGYLKELKNKNSHHDTESVRSPSAADINVVTSVTRSYSLCSEFLSGDRKNSKKNNKIIELSTSGVDTAELFMESLVSLNILLEDYLKQNKLYSVVNPSSSSHKVSNSSSSSNGLIFTSSQTGIIHELDKLMRTCADAGTKSCVEEEIPSLMGFLAEVEVQESYDSSLEDNKFLPSRFIQVNKDRYFVDNNSYSNNMSIANKQRNILSLPGVSKEDLKPANIKVTMNKEEYRMASEVKRRNFNIKISALRQAGEGSLVLGNRPDNFYPKYLQSNISGISLTTSKFSSTAVPSSPDQALEKTLKDMIPDTSDSIQESIIKSAYEIEDRKDFEEYIATNYKELISLKDSLGSFYEEFNAFLGRQEAVSNLGENKIDYQKEFEQGRSEYSTSGNNKAKDDPFQSECFKATALCHGIGKKEISKQMVQEVSETLKDQNRTGMVFFKFETNEQKNVPLINNGILMRL